MAELDRLTSSLAINDPLKGGPNPQEAPPEEEEKDPFELGFRGLASRSGVSTTALDKSFRSRSEVPTEDVVESERKKNNVFHSILNNDFIGPSVVGFGVPNPGRIIKGGLNVLGAVQNHFAAPVWGLAMYGVLRGQQALDTKVGPLNGRFQIFPQTQSGGQFGDWGPYSKGHELIENYKQSLMHNGGAIRGIWGGSGDWNRERDSYFFGEKFLGSIVADPTSYLGFGLMAKIPLVGRTTFRLGMKGFNVSVRGRAITLPNVRTLGRLRDAPGMKHSKQIFRNKYGHTVSRKDRHVEISLGALESGYVDAFNLPFKAALSGYKHLPESARILTKKTTGQSGKTHGALISSNFTKAVVRAMGGGTNFLNISNITWREGFKQRIGNMSIQTGKLSRSEAEVRKIMYGKQEITPSVLISLAQRAKIVLGLDDKQMSAIIGRAGISVQGSMAETIGELFAKMVRMESTPTEVGEQLIRLSGGVHSRKNQEAVEEFLKSYANTVHKNVENKVLNNNLENLRTLLSTEAENFRIANIEMEIAARRKGMIGGFLNGFDVNQKRFYQRGLRKHAIRPIATAVLIFPGFPMQEYMEGSTRQLFGDSALGMHNRQFFDETLSFFGAGPRSLHDLDQASRIANTRLSTGSVAEGTAGGIDSPWLEGLSPDFLKRIISKGEMTIQGEKFNWFSPTDYVHMTGAISGGMRRRYLNSRMYQRSMNYLAHEQPELMSVVEHAFPEDAIQGELVQSIQEAFVLRIMSGNSDAVRDVPRIFSRETIQLKEAHTIVDTMGASGDIPSAAMQSLRAWVDGGRRFEDLPALLVDVQELAADEYLKGAEGFVHGMKGLRGAMKQAAEVLRGQKAARGGDFDIAELDKIESLAYQTYQGIDDMSHRIDGILQDTAQKVHSQKLTVGKKDVAWRNASKKVEETVTEADKVMGEIHTLLKDLELEGFGDTIIADHFKKEWDLTHATWIRDRDAVNEYFLTGNRKANSFWQNLGPEVRGPIWNDYRARRMELKVEGSALQAKLKTALGGKPFAFKKLNPKDFKNEKLDMEDIGYMLSAHSDNVYQALINGSVMSEDDFVKYVFSVIGSEPGITGVSERAVRQARKNFLEELNLTDEIQNGQEVLRKSIQSNFFELRGKMHTSSWQDPQVDALRKYANTVADEMDKLDGIRKRELSQAQVAERSLIHDQAFDDAEISGRPREVEEDIIRGGGIQIPEREMVGVPNSAELQIVGTQAYGAEIKRALAEGRTPNLRDVSSRVQSNVNPGAFDQRLSLLAEREILDELKTVFKGDKDALDAIAARRRQIGQDDSARNIEHRRSQARVNLSLDEDVARVNPGIPRIQETQAARIESRIQDARSKFGTDMSKARFDEARYATIDKISIDVGTDPIIIDDIMEGISTGDRDDILQEVQAHFEESLTTEIARSRRAISDPNLSPEVKDNLGDTYAGVFDIVEAQIDRVKKLRSVVSDDSAGQTFGSLSDGFADEIIQLLGDTPPDSMPLREVQALIRADAEQGIQRSRKQLQDLDEIDRLAELSAIERGQAVRRAEDDALKIPLPPNTKPKMRIRKRGDEILKLSIDDLNKAFVNYDGSTMIDDMAQGIFPFWTYESRRIPYLLRTGFQKPGVMSTIMPEGRYAEATDDGYLPVWGQKWMDMNVLGGTMYNMPRRMSRAQFPEQHITGVQGAYSKVETQLGRFGFYFGTHISAIPELVLPAMGIGEGGERGELLPPMASGLTALVEAGANPLPGTQQHIPLISHFSRGVSKLRRAMFPDRFREFFIGRIMAERGLDVTELDWKAMKPKLGSSTLTQTDIDDAVALASIQEWVSESVGNVRFEGPNKKKFDDQRDKFIAEWTPLTVEQIRNLRRDGVNPTDLYPLPGPVKKIFSEIPNAVNFGVASSRLAGGDIRKFEDHISEFWDQVDVYRKDLLAEQGRDDDKWFMGEGTPGGFSPSAWRTNKEDRGGKVSDAVNFLRGRKRNSDGVEVIFNPRAQYVDVPISYEEILSTAKRFGNDSLRFRHVFDELTTEFFNITPKDYNGDGFLEWGKFFNERDNFMTNVLPPDLKGVFLQHIESRLTPVEQELSRLQRGILGQYWNMEDELIEELGVRELVNDVIAAQRFDPDSTEFLKRNPIYKRYTRELRKRREISRKLSPELDYALNIFGFTGKQVSFQNPIAESWWKSDGFAPRLNRLPQ